MEHLQNKNALPLSYSLSFTGLSFSQLFNTTPFDRSELRVQLGLWYKMFLTEQQQLSFSFMYKRFWNKQRFLVFSVRNFLSLAIPHALDATRGGNVEKH